MEIYEPQRIEKGRIYNVTVDAKGAQGEGIGRVGRMVVFVKSAKTRLGSAYDIRITRVYRTFAYGELNEPKRQFIGNGGSALI